MMRQQSLFATEPQEHPYQLTADRLARLAEKKIYFGSSSWKYDSWQGAVYVEPYDSKKDFERNCLEEYARLFSAVGADFSFYNWPSPEMIALIDNQTRPGFKFGLKATEFVTLKRYPNIPRWGANAGKPNPDFLNPILFQNEFLDRLTPLQESGKLAPIIMEFTAFPRGAFQDWTEFAVELEGFFEEIFKRNGDKFQFGIELRTKEYIHEEFYAALKAMGAAPILNSWTRTPPLDEQFKLFQQHDFPFVEVRTVMRPGRTREEAVELFEPYDRNKETVLPVRRALKRIVDWAIKNNRPAYLFINNHLEGCAHQTISEIVAEFEP